MMKKHISFQRNTESGRSKVVLSCPARSKCLLYLVGIVFTSITLSSCEDFFSPSQNLIRESDEMFADWDEYRSAEMGIYSLQQKLVEQLFVLGELRGDLLEVTENANQELLEVYNFSISKENPYASPVNFYKLIMACNRLIQQLSAVHPEVLDKDAAISNYDRLYGEALCMRAWAYFNAVRIYKEVPYIHETLNSVEEIEEYINSPGEYVISEYIKFAPEGFYNDTIRDTTIVVQKQFLNQKLVVETFSAQLENNIKAVGVNHSINNGDDTWSVTIWNDYARHALLGQMYMFDQNYTAAMEHFSLFLINNSSETSNIRFGLDDKFQNAKWKNIFTTIDSYEHIYTLWFGKSYKQTNELQTMMSVVLPNNYMIKPTSSCINNWEAIWNDPIYNLDYSDPEESEVIEPGIPGDFYRGYGVSYKYYKNGVALSADEVQDMLLKKLDGNMLDVLLLMEGVDTVATKYDIGKTEYAHDANFIIYRAASIHLYAAEIYAVWEHIFGGLSTPRSNSNRSLNILNDGSYENNLNQLGVRGRVGFANTADEKVELNNIIFYHDPVTNKIIDYSNFSNNSKKKTEYLLEKILEERARELAFEGERFYDLIRIAKRREDPSYLADKVAAKFKGEQKEVIRSFLMNEDNWYIDFY